MNNENDTKKNNGLLNRQYIKNIIIIILIISISLLFFSLKKAIIPFIIGIFFAYLLNPLVIFLQNKGYPRKGAVILLTITIFNILFISGIFILPLFTRELKTFVEILPEYMTLISTKLTKWSNYLKVYFPTLVTKGIIERFFTQFEEYLSLKMNVISDFIMNSINLIISFFAAPVITYYILRDIEIIKKVALKVIPSGKKGNTLKLIRNINGIFSGYLRGQAWLSIIIAILTSVGLVILKIKFFLLLGIIAGITNMIPYIGPVVGAIPAIIVALLASPIQAVGTIILFILIQQLESSFIQPHILSENVGLHPLTVIFSLLAGADLFGIWGLIFAIPVAGIIKSFIEFIVDLLVPLDNYSN